MSGIDYEPSHTGKPAESCEEQKIGSILKKKSWGRLWDTVRSYLKNRAGILKTVSARIEELSDPRFFEEVESLLECLSEEAAARLYITLIYKCAVLNGDTGGGRYFLNKLKNLPLSHLGFTKYEWHMAVKSEASGVEGAFDAVKEITGESTDLNQHMEVLPALFRIAGENRELMLKIINHTFYAMWHTGNIEGFLSIEEPLQDFSDILASFNIIDINIWDKILKTAKVVNGVEEVFYPIYYWDEVPKPIDMNEEPADGRVLHSTLAAIHFETQGHPLLCSICDIVRGNMTEVEKKLHNCGILRTRITSRSDQNHKVKNDQEAGTEETVILPLSEKTHTRALDVIEKINDDEKKISFLFDFGVCLENSKNIEKQTLERTLDECSAIKNHYYKIKLIASMFPKFLSIHSAEEIFLKLKLGSTEDIKLILDSGALNLNESGETEKAFSVWINNFHLTEKTAAQFENPHVLLHSSLYLLKDNKTCEALEILEKTFDRINAEKDDDYKCDFIEETARRAADLEVRNSNFWVMIFKHVYEISCNSLKAGLLGCIAGYLWGLSLFEKAGKTWLDALTIIEQGLQLSDVSGPMESILIGIQTHEVSDNELLSKALEISGKIVKKWNKPGPFIETLKILLSANPDGADLWDESFMISETMTENENLVTVYCHIAARLADTGCQEGAKKYLKRAELLAEGLSNNYLKDSCLKEAAIRYGEIGFLEEGLGIGKKIRSKDTKAEVYSFIAFKMSQNGEEKESDIVLKHALNIGNFTPNKSSCLASVVFWAAETRDKDKTLNTMDSVFNIINCMTELSDKFYTMMELIKRTAVQTENNIRELLLDMIKYKTERLIYELVKKPCDDTGRFIVSNAAFCLEQAGVLNAGPWQTVIRVSEKIKREHDRAQALYLVALALVNAGINDDSIILMLEQAADRLNSPEYISKLYFCISRLYNTCGNTGGAMKALEKINKKDTRLSAATWILMDLIRNEEIDTKFENAGKLIMLLIDYPEYLSKYFFPYLLEYYQPANRDEIEKLISFLIL